MDILTPAQSPGTNGSAGTGGFPPADPLPIVHYLTSVLEAALGADREDLENPGSLLHKSRYADTVQRCTRFATDTQTVLYIQKDLVPASTTTNGTTETSESSLLVARKEKRTPLADLTQNRRLTCTR